MQDTRVMELSDGRELAWVEFGNPAGKPIIGFHGTPGSRLQLDRNVPVAHARQMSAAIPGAILHEVSGAGHLMSLDLTAEICSTLARHL